MFLNPKRNMVRHIIQVNLLVKFITLSYNMLISFYFVIKYMNLKVKFNIWGSDA